MRLLMSLGFAARLAMLRESGASIAAALLACATEGAQLCVFARDDLGCVRGRWGCAGSSCHDRRAAAATSSGRAALPLPHPAVPCAEQLGPSSALPAPQAALHHGVSVRGALGGRRVHLHPTHWLERCRLRARTAAVPHRAAVPGPRLAVVHCSRRPAALQASPKQWPAQCQPWPGCTGNAP